MQDMKLALLPELGAAQRLCWSRLKTSDPIGPQILPVKVWLTNGGFCFRLAEFFILLKVIFNAIRQEAHVSKATVGWRFHISRILILIFSSCRHERPDFSLARGLVCSSACLEENGNEGWRREASPARVETLPASSRWPLLLPPAASRGPG